MAQPPASQVYTFPKELLPPRPAALHPTAPPVPTTPYNPTIQIKDRRPVGPGDRQDASPTQLLVSQLIASARNGGQDPATVLSMALQETGFNSRGLRDNNPLNVLKTPYNEDPRGELAVALMNQKLREHPHPASEALKIQAFNGLGILKPLPGSTSMYGIPLPIDTRKNPVYGKRVIDLRENVIKPNKDIQALIAQLTQVK